MKRSEIKQHIIKTASSLFYTNGYNSTGINEIISESGIAKATLYNHFKSKEEICISYLKYKNTTFLTDIKSFCNSKPKGKDQILAIFDFLESFYNNENFNGCWCINTISEIPKNNNKNIRLEIRDQKQLFLTFILELLNQNFDIELNKEILSKQIYLLYEGAVAESHLHNENWPIKEAKNICEKIIE